MKTACLAIPPQDELYPWRAARAGLERLGLQVIMGGGPGVLDADLLVTWSPWNGSFRQGLQLNYTRAGKPVIVMENGWLSPLGPQPMFQVARDGWNGTGRFSTGGPERWRSWRVDLVPWRHTPGTILVCGQRGHPSDARTAPPDWHKGLQIAGVEERRIYRRARGATRPLQADLLGAEQVHVWTSNAASLAITTGIPVIQHGPNLMVAALASFPGEPLFRGEREAELERLAWAQWSAAEIETGHPFARLVEAP